jgi:hypothetical protein
MKRYWINQPSKLQKFNNLHGENVLADIKKGEKFTRIYFTCGRVISMDFPVSALSEGWKNNL